MSIKEWKPEYERLSTEKLSLLGVIIEHEFESGIRLIRLTESDCKDLMLINIEDKRIKFNQQDLSKLIYHEELGVYEVTGVTEALVGSYVTGCNNSVILDKNGNILIGTCLDDIFITEVDFYSKSIEQAERFMCLFEKLLENYREVSNKPYIQKPSYVNLIEHERYLVIRFDYNVLYSSVLIYDKQERKVLHRLHGASIRQSTVKKDSKESTILYITTTQKTYLILENETEIYEGCVDALSNMFNSHGNLPEFLHSWYMLYYELTRDIKQAVQARLTKIGYSMEWSGK